MIVEEKNVPKIALLTGGNRGLGKAMAISLAKKGIDLVLTYRNDLQKALETAKEIEDLGQKAVILPLDLADFSSLDSFVTKFREVLDETWHTSGFNFLINNAGMGATVSFELVTPEIFDNFLNVHFKSVYFLTQKCVPYLLKEGRIINISSGTTRFSNPGYSVYASMKGAVEVLTKYLARELGQKGITANIVAPGPVETDFNNAAIRNNSALKERLSALSPLNRVGNTEDIGGVVAFLCTPEARWINGQRIEVSGGING